MDPAQQALPPPDRPVGRLLGNPMDAGLPIATQQAAPTSPGAKPLGLPTTGAAAKGPLVGFEALLAALFKVQDTTPTEAPANPTVGPIAKAQSSSGQPIGPDASGDDDLRVAPEPGRSPKDAAIETAVGSVASTPDALLLTSLQITLPTRPDQPILVPGNPDEVVSSRPKLDLPLRISSHQDLQIDPGLSLATGPSPTSDTLSAPNGPTRGSAQTSNLPAQLATSTEAPRSAPQVREISPPVTYAPPPVTPSTPVLAQSQQASLTPLANLKPLPDGIAAADSAARNRNSAKIAVTGLGPSSSFGSSMASATPLLSPAVVGPVVNEVLADAQPPPEDIVLAINPESDKLLAEAGRDAVQTPFSPSAGVAQSTTIAVRAGPETVTNLAAHIIRNLEGRATRFDVELHPADLGRVDVRLEIGAHGRLKASMSFENPQAAADMRGRSDELHRALEQAGFDLSGGLSFDVAGDGGRGQNASPQDPSTLPNGARGRAFDAAMALANGLPDSALASALSTYQVRRAAGLDIRI